MKLARIVSVGVLAAALSSGTLHAQIREQQPAEFPPSSFKGKQYVDSKGCVFIRAGIDGDVSWIPRVTRARKTVCGFKPSLAGGVASAPAPAAAPSKPVQKITVAEAAPAAAAAPKAKAKPRKAAPVARQSAPSRVVRQTAPKRVVRKAAPKPAPVVVAAAPKPAPAAKTRRKAQQVATACPGASRLSQAYMRSNGLAVRCGPQAAPIVGTALRAGTQVANAPAPSRVVRSAPAAAAAPVITGQTRIVPKHVARNRINTQDGVRVPAGYKKVWDDGRLNPNRAEQTLAGRRDMRLIWTDTVPRRLIDTRTGGDVTAKMPLVYPYIDVVTQSRELGEVKLVRRNGTLVKRIRRHAGVAPYKASTGTTVYSSRSAPRAKAAAQPAPAKAQPRAVAGKRYVQIGTYGNPANARKAAQQVARMGLPARIGKHRRNGKILMSVQAGPFARAEATGKALHRLKRAGYRDAFARN